MRLSPTNPMGRALMAQLLFDVIAYGLALPLMLTLQHVRPALAWGSVGLVVVLALVGAATLRRGFGYYLSWAAVVGGLLLGLLTPMMWVVGGLLLVLWVASFVLGRRLEAGAAQ